MGGRERDPRVLRPLEAVEAAFRAAAAQAAPGAPPADGDWGLGAQFGPFLADAELRRQVPSLNAVDPARVPAGTLVRFRGLVQDVLDPEYYVGAFQAAPGGGWESTKFRDHAERPLPEAGATAVWERRPVFCVQVPGEAAWVQAGDARASAPVFDRPAPAAAREKRGRDAMEVDGGGGPAAAAGPEPALCQPVAKQPRQGAGGGAADAGGVNQGAIAAANGGERPCLLKLYAGQLGELGELKLNDTVEVVGVLSRNPVLFEPDAEFGFEDEQRARNPPESQVRPPPPVPGRPEPPGPSRTSEPSGC